MEGGTVEYSTLIKLTNELRLAVRSELVSLSGSLLASRLISLDNEIELRNTAHSEVERAAKLVELVQNKVQQNYRHYYSFIGILQGNQDQYMDILQQLEHPYQEHNGSAQIVPHSDMQSHIHVHDLECRFSSLHEKILSELQDRHISVSELLSSLTVTPAGIRQEYKTSISEAFPNIRKETTIREAFYHLSPLLDFLSCNLLKYIIEVFGSNPLKIEMKAYNDNVLEFMKRTTVKQLMDHLSDQYDEVPPNFSKLRARIDEDPSIYSLYQLDQLRKRYCCELKLTDVVLVLIGLEMATSFVVEWLIPSAIVPQLIESAKQLDFGFYHNEHIVQIAVDGEQILHWAIVEQQSMDVQVIHVCSNPGCIEPLPNKEGKVCSKCKTQQGLPKQQSMDAQVVCINPGCREPLLSKEDKVCYKCEAPQTLCINPVCRTPLFTLNQGMCHKCLLSQKSEEKTTGGDPDNKADGSPKLPSKSMETKNSADSTSQQSASVESSVDKSDPNAEGTSSELRGKEKIANASQDSMATATATPSEKNGHPPATGSTVSPTDKPAQAHSNASSRKSSMTSDSGESSDSDEFATPTPDHYPSDLERGSKGTPDKDGATSVAVLQIKHTRLSLEDTRDRKHECEQDETEESTSSKRRGLEDDEELKLSPKAVTLIKAGECAEVKKQQEKKGTEMKIDKHKGSCQQHQQQGDECQGTKGKGGAGSTQEMTVYMKKDYDEAQEEGLVGDKEKKSKKNIKKDRKGGKEETDGLSRPTTRSQTAAMRVDTTGFHPPPEKSLEVTFHVLLPKEVWNWGKKSRMHMRFSHPRLGEWKEDVGEFNIKRDLENGLMEMECTLLIDSTLLKHGGPISYKYRVHTCHDESDASAYEFLHGAPGGKGDIIDRRLIISLKDIKDQGQYHQYDSMVYPDSAKMKGLVTKFVNYFVGQSSKEEALYVPDHATMQKKALEVFLEDYRNILVSGVLSQHLDVVQIAGKMAYIFRQLYLQRISHSRDIIWVADKLPEAMRAWLQSAAEDLQGIEIHSCEDNGKRMASALAILVTMDHLIPNSFSIDQVDFKVTELLFILLCPQPDSDKQTCPDLDFVLSLIPKDGRKMVCEALGNFCWELSHRRHLTSPQWLYALPLFHFLRDPRLKQFHRIQCNPKEVPWVDTTLGLGAVRSSTLNRTYGIMGRLCSELEPLMLLDPLVLTTFVYVCPKAELPAVFERISSYFATAWLVKNVKDNRFFLRSYVKEITELTNVIINRQQNEPLPGYQELLKTMSGAYWLFNEFVHKELERIEDYHREAIKAIFSLFLSSASRFRHFVDSNNNMKDAYNQQMTSAIEAFHKQISYVFNKVYSQSFGRCGRDFVEYNSRLELKAWMSLIEFENLRVHKEILALWHGEIIEKIIRERLTPLHHGPRVKLFIILDSQGNAHPIVINVFMDSIMQSLKHVSAKDIESSVNSSQKEAVGKIFDRILTRQYPKTKYISLDDLLLWDLWPNYILMYKSEIMIKRDGKDRGQSCLPEQSNLLCGVAISTLDDYCNRIDSGKITVKELQLVSGKRDQMEKLCSAATTGSLEKKGEEYHRIEMALDTRIREYTTFMKRRELLGNLCNGVTVQVVGLPELIRELDQDFESKPIKSLCVSRGPSHIENHCFLAAAPLDQIKMKYDFMVRHHQNDFFHEIWEHTAIHAARASTGLTIPDIVTKIWTPAFEECCRLLDMLRDCSITLREVDERFLRFDNNISTITFHLGQLHRGVEGCLDQQPSARHPAWIDSAVERMQQYWTLLRYAKAAQTVLELRDMLDLTGDFSLMETIAKKMSSSMKDRTLDVIDQSLINAGEFLGMVEGDKRRLDCLRTFADSLEVIEWIRKETKGLDDLHNFVSVALHTTAGESDFDSDRLSNLEKVGNGFGPLIFGLMKNKNFEAFRQGCIAVWDAMENAPDLPKKLVGCKSELAWYKSVKETQDSIEEINFGQLNNILAYGCYYIGSRIALINFDSIHDIIHLTLTEYDKPLTKKQYTLNDLRDLDSKLALIVGKNAKNKTQVGVFTHMLHNVCRIAEVLIDLQRDGNVKYIGWRLQVPCGLHHIMPMLQEQAKEMEQELANWKEEVTKKRGEFYELNYYTTLQLLTLRRELGVIKSEPNTGPAAVIPNVLALLESISNQVTAPLVHTIVQNVISDGIRSAASAPSISTQDELSQDHREMIQDLIKEYDFPNQLVLKAFEVCKENAAKYDIQNWCLDNLDKCAFDSEAREGDISDDDEDDNKSEASSMESEDEGYSYQHQATPLSVSAFTPKDFTSPGTPRSTGHSGIRQIMVQPQLLIDSSHPVVQQLCSGGFTEEQSIDAVERYETLERAMDYLMSVEEDEEMFQMAPPGRQDPSSLWRKSSGGVRYMEPLDPLYSDVEPTIRCDPNAEKSYLNLEELGCVLTRLTSILQSGVPIGRSFNTRILKCGHPNLIVTPPDNVLRTVLALFMEDEALPLPSLEEVLICNSNTTAEEVTLLWQRAIDDPDFKRIFCLVHAERLTYQVSDKALRSLSDLSQGRRDYRLVIICSNEEEEKSHFISKLHSCRRPFAQKLDTDQCQRYLKAHFTGQVESLSSPYSQLQPAMASAVDHEQSRVRLVTSLRSGMGKSLYIQRMVEQLQMNMRSTGKAYVTVPLHGPKLSPDVVMDYLEKYMQESACTIFHLDIAPTILSEVDTILFSLLILGGLTNSQGHVWRCRPGQLYAVELTLSEKQERTALVGQTIALTELLPAVHCVSPQQAKDVMGEDGTTDPSIVAMDEQVFTRPICQRVYQYLRRHMGGCNLDSFSYGGNVEGTKKNCLETFLHNCGIRDPSWCEIWHFIKFLNIQLQSCEASVFCDEMFVGDVMSGLKSFVVKFMIRMSRDFATSSLQGEVARENLEDMEAMDGGEEGNLEQYQIAIRRRWERNSHPYIFFNQGGMSITFIGFMVTRNGDLVDPAHRGTLEQGIMTPQLYTGLKQIRVNFDDDYRQWQKSTMIEKIATVMGIEFPYDPDETYVLTVDNLIKILAIQMRFRCGIPVVIMGETGCGKTRLIRYMCDLARQGEKKRNMLIMKVHGGTTEDDIEKFIKEAEKEAEQNYVKKMDTVVFFDEANTTDAIGLIKEIMCDRRIHGKSISDDLKFIAACNPYRKHSEDMIKKLENAGVGFYVRETETHQKLGKIPLRQLVYRVLDLPPSMRPLVYDFGQLQQITEDDYIRQIVHDHVFVHPGLSQECPHYIGAIAKVLAWSQAYMRGRKDECSFVSLRDVERAMIVFKYFYEKMDIFGPLINQKQQEEEDEKEDSYDEESEDEGMLREVVRPQPQAIGKITRALILSLSVCYHARLQDRDAYEEGASEQFVNPLSLPGGDDRFRDEIRWCQEVLLDNMRLGDNIAKNAALRENVFMMVICIELRIPLFIVGKPGSSKSLAKAVIHASMQGKSSHSELLRNFKEVDMFSYQCSQLSTPESVIEVFNTASRFQSKQDTKNYVAVVVLDEVGLAEDSPNLPLKALHPLLEDGTEGAGAEGKNDMIIGRGERVAFIGISNWALDPAKMNRGVMVTRGDPSEDELEYSAEGICSNKENDPVKTRLKQYFKPLSEAYMEICEKQDRQFFGLRDFYSLIKMLYWMCEKSDNPPTWPQLEHAIKRNFGGLESTELDPVKIFIDKLPCRREPPDLSGVPEEFHSIVSPDCTRFGLIQASLSYKERTWHGENRHLLFLTENYAALDILKHSNQTLYTADVKQETMKPFILFGSSFPKDQEYTQVCRNINQIKICMETGRTVILLNLDNLYECLYDMLNQYYIYNGGNRYVNLGLQTHRAYCRVHDDFKLILIAEKKKVYEKFATPLINRLEKHFVLSLSVLEGWQKELLRKFEAWISQFCETRGKRFARGDAFIGYQKDTPAAVVFQASNFLRRLREEDDESMIHNKLELLDRAGILENMSLSVLLDREEITEQWRDAVLPLSQFLLLQMAAPDAIIRLQNTNLEDREAIEEVYFKKLHHQSIEQFLIYQLERCQGKGGLLIQVTTHSHLLAYDELEQVRRAVGMRVENCSLHEFETELDFTSKIGPYFKIEKEDDQPILVVIQCDSGHSNGDLIACAKNRIYNIRSEKERDTHVVFVIHFPHQAANSSFVGFQGDPWISVHIDDLRPTSDSTIMPYEAMGTAISQLFMGNIAPDDQFGLPMDQEGVADANKEEESDTEMDSKPSHREDKREGRQTPPSELEEEGKSMDEDELPPNEDIGERMSEGSGPDEGERMEAEETAIVHGVVEEPQRVTLPPPQCQRLHGCIQAAASKLQDDNKRRATQRVEILVNLIPKDIQFPFDLTTFHGILVQHIFSVLKQRDHIWEADRQWVLNEAMDARKLQNGGTFRNVLARKIDEVVVPIFSEIIACMDCNYNLDLINPRGENTPLCQFWLSMFGRPKIMQFNYVKMMTPREKVPGVGGRRSAEDFKCQLPFSWIIKEAVDAQWDNAKSSAGNNRQALHKQLCEAIHQIEVGEVLLSVQDGYCEEFYKYYLHDFVRNVHKSQNKKQEQAETEYSLIQGALDEMVHDEDFSSMDGQDTLIRRISALHVVYMFSTSQIMWFGHLVSQKPGIMLALKDKQSPDISEMVLHLFAVEKALDDLKPPMEANKVVEHLLPWLNDLRLSQNAVDTILSLPPHNTMLENARLKWQLIRAMQMFLEHVLLKHPEVPVTYVRRLELFLMSGSDFLKRTALEKVKEYLNQIHIQLKSKHRPKTVSSIQKSCHEFFMEVVSNLCFGGHKPPEPDLIKMLMNTIFTERKEDTALDTRDITPYQADPDQVPVVRFFLLQLLLEHNSELVKEHLKDYFDRSHQVFGRQTDQGLCLLCIQCFEDALYKEFYEKSFASRVEDTINILEDGRQALRQLGQCTDTVTLDYLEGVAKVRFALSVVAELLNENDQPRSNEDSVLVVQLLHEAREVCVDSSINSIDDTGQRDTVGPVVFLIKLLVRQYGLKCLEKASEAHAWIVPEQLKQTGEEEKIIDPFVVYNDFGYHHMRLAVSNAAYGKQLSRLVEATKNMNVQEAVPLLLALYQKITLSRASTQASKQIFPDVLGEFNKFILKCKALPREMQWMARSLIANEQGGPFPLLSVTPHQPPQCRTLTALVVHAAVVFFSRQKLEVLWPFLHMLTDPAKLANAYLPTMAENHLQEARHALGGAFYDCPRGHPYFVGKCGQPMQELTCLTCGARVGGINHKLRTDNAAARLHDATQTGHDLGDPTGRTTVPAPERNLSPSAICVLRALMHSALLWACCNNNQRIGDIVQLVKPHIPVQALPEFFWRHLDKDIELLGRAVGKGYEEAAMIVHLVLREILVKETPGIGVKKTLAARIARGQWETVFNKHYIQPVLGSLEQKLGLAMQTVLSDFGQEHNQLLFLVYERMELMNESSIQPHLWTYHSRITLEHLAQTLQEKKMKEKYPILYEFLQSEPVLRATQYLPDIVRLQQCLYDAFHHRLDKKDAVTQTIREFLDNLTTENARNEYHERIESLQKAWALVGYMLKNHARLRVEEKYLIPTITLDTTLEYLIPTTTEAGACTTALVDFLVLSHNDFIKKCRATVSKDPMSAALWRDYKVPITHIHRCHLVDYEHQLLSIILSHCNYSLTFGKGQSIKYDHAALQKHILDRFIHGKPRILSDIPHVVYRKDIYTTVTIAAVRKKVKNQEQLNSHVKQEILSELRTPDHLREALDVVEIVLGFLSSGGGKADKPLGEYIDRMLKMKRRPFSSKAREYCCLGHILSLWETISVELAKQLYLRGQEPFDSVCEEFLKPFEETEVEVLEKCLRLFDLDSLLGTLYEFIETHVKHSPDGELEWPVKDTLEKFLDRNDLPHIQSFDGFPDDITLSKAIAAWKCVVNYQEKVKQS